MREENVTVSLGFSLRFTTRIHFTFSSTARIGHSLRPSSSIRVLLASSYRLLPASGHYPRLIVIPLGTLPSSPVLGPPATRHRRWDRGP